MRVLEAGGCPNNIMLACPFPLGTSEFLHVHCESVARSFHGQTEVDPLALGCGSRRASRQTWNARQWDGRLGLAGKRRVLATIERGSKNGGGGTCCVCCLGHPCLQRHYRAEGLGMRVRKRASLRVCKRGEESAGGKYHGAGLAGREGMGPGMLRRTGAAGSDSGSRNRCGVAWDLAPRTARCARTCHCMPCCLRQSW